MKVCAPPCLDLLGLFEESIEEEIDLHSPWEILFMFWLIAKYCRFLRNLLTL
jgi:hypothetical protein